MLLALAHNLSTKFLSWFRNEFVRGALLRKSVVVFVGIYVLCACNVGSVTSGAVVNSGTDVRVSLSNAGTAAVSDAQDQLPADAGGQRVTRPEAACLLTEIDTNVSCFFVDSYHGNDDNHGRSADKAWSTITRVNRQTFSPGDIVIFRGVFRDDFLRSPGSGTIKQPIVFVGIGPFNGRAQLSGMRLSDTQHVVFRNFEAFGPGTRGLVRTEGSKPVKFLLFDNLYLHDAVEGIYITGPFHSDLTFLNSQIDRMDRDGILLDDQAGDRFSFIGGSIMNTGLNPPKWNTHGVYASGGHGHLFDGVEFRDIASVADGWAISIRRGDFTIRNCIFATPYMINNNNEDEGSVNQYTGSPSRNLSYRIYRNLFIGPGAIYQSTNVDHGVDDPGNSWLIFNNTFINMTLHFGGATSPYYDIYMRNNLFIDSVVRLSASPVGKVRELSNNGWWNSGEPRGILNVEADPKLDDNFQVTAAEYRDVGTTRPGPGITLVPNPNSPFGFVGEAPDIGQTER